MSFKHAIARQCFTLFTVLYPKEKKSSFFTHSNDIHQKIQAA
ncbi:hypothetical protein ACQ4M4_21430 [Leptolyngbya sp. AN02str]